MNKRWRNILQGLILSSAVLGMVKVEAGSLLDYYRKVGEKLVRPDVTRSRHPIAKGEMVRPGVFIDTETPLQPDKMEESEAAQEALSKAMERVQGTWFGRDRLLRRLEEFRGQKCFLNQAERDVINDRLIRDVLAIQDSHHFSDAMAKKLATRSAANVMPRALAGESYTYQKAYEAIREFLGDPERVVSRMRELEREVLLLKKAHRGINPRLHLQEVLARWERHGGFNPAVILPPRLLSGKEWFQMLKDGALFYDIYWEPRWYEPHGAESHRLQWHLILREIEDNPERYFGTDKVKAVKLFQEMGNMQLTKNLQWPDQLRPGERSLWYQTVDTEEMNFTGPVLTRWLAKKMNGLSDSR